MEAKKDNILRRFTDKLFGGLNMSWPVVIIFAVATAVVTSVFLIFPVFLETSFNRMGTTFEAWIFFAIIIMSNCKKPLESAFKTFVFFLIIQPLIYLIQVPFSEMGWQLFMYYKYWFIATLLTFPAAFVGWYMKKDKWYSGVILSAMTVLLVYMGFSYAKGFSESFPNHLISTIYCFGIIPVFIFGIFKNKEPRIVTALISIVALITLSFVVGAKEPYETYNNSFTEGITFVGEPYISFFSSEGGSGDVEIIKTEDGTYNFKLMGEKGTNYRFAIADGENEYTFKYYFDANLNTVIVEKSE